jgi:hypothetical protein
VILSRSILIYFAIVLLAPTPAGAAERPFSEIIFIDHNNLRRIRDEPLIRIQVAQIRKNLDQAARYGADTYLLFAKDTMDAMLTYDFDVPGIGHIGRQAFPEGSEHRQRASYLRAALNEVLDYASQKKLRVFFHSNQFIFPQEVLGVIKPAIWGTAICPAREATWRVYRAKLEEFFRLFPGIAGLQVTGDETQVSVLECKCDQCSRISFVARVNRLTQETAQVCQRYGKEVQMRTWQRMGELEKESHPSRMAEGLPANVFFSIKNTLGDFELINPMDKVFLTAANPSRLVVEFDAWREYDGNNYFPCYMGDIWAPRMRFLHEKNIRRIAVRLLWESDENPIFERPWGNFVNLYTFLAFSRDPKRAPDEILNEFIDKYYPASARKAAFDLYKFSTDFQRSLYYLKGIDTANHSRVQDDDAVTDLAKIQEAGFFTKPEHFEQRRAEIERFCRKGNELVDRLGSKVPAEWRQGLKDGIRVERYQALGTSDKAEAIFWKNQSNRDKMTEVVVRIKGALKDWKAWHPDSYEAMNAEDMLRHY